MAQTNIPYYNEAYLPCLAYPINSHRDLPERYLGTRAITKQTYIDLNFHASTDEEMDALQDFWEINCNYGLDPFVIALSVNGYTSAPLPFDFFLVRFIGDTNDTKGTKNWTVPRKLKVVGAVSAIVDDAGNLITSDAQAGLIPDSMLLSDAVDYFMSEVTEIPSYRKVIFGKDDSLKIDYDMDSVNIKFDSSRTMDNKAVSGQVYDGKLNGSNHVKIFNGVQSVPLNIHHTLGNELLSDTTLDTGVSFNAYHSIYSADLTVFLSGTKSARFDEDGINTNLFGRFTLPTMELGKTYIIRWWEQDGIGYTPYRYMVSFSNGANSTDGYKTGRVNGNWYEVEVIKTITDISQVYYGVSYSQTIVIGNGAKFWIDGEASVKELSNPSSYLTMYNPITKLYNTLDMSLLTPSLTYLQENDFSNAFATDVPLTDAHRAYLLEYHEAIGDIWFGKKSHPKLGLTSANIKHWYPANEGVEGGEWLHDVCVANTNGANIVTLNAIDIKYNATFTTTKIDTFNETLESDGLGTGTQAYQTHSMPLVSAGLYYVRLTYELLIGGDIMKSTLYFGSTSYYTYSEKVIGNKRILDVVFYKSEADRLSYPYIILYATTNVAGMSKITFTTPQLFDGSRITSFDPTCRTTHLNTNHGLSNFFIKQDVVTGRALDMSDGNSIECNNDGRFIDTNWTPVSNKDFSLEAVYTPTDIQSWHGCWGNSPSTVRLAYGTEVNLAPRFDIGNISINNTGASAQTLLHFLIVFHTETSTFDLYVNGINKRLNQLTDFSGALSSFLIGKTNMGNNTKGKHGYFKVHNKALTPAEVTVQYSNAKLIYPTLP